MARAGEITVPVVAAVYRGDEAKTLLAQAQGYKQIVWLILTGVADRDPAEFISQCKAIGQRAAEDGA